MFNRKTEPKTPSDLDNAITECIKGLEALGDGTEEYVRATASLKALMEARKVEEETYPSWRPSADTIAVVTGNILGIVSILMFEKANVITSKALTFVAKPRP